jgi:hypothetical protein
MPLKSNLAKIRRGLKPAHARANRRSAELIVDVAQQLAPYDNSPEREPGPHLKDTIKVASDEGEVRQVVTAGEGLNDPRAVVNEYGGTSINFPAQPYMTPAAEAIKPAVEVKKELLDLYRSNGL